MLNNEYISKWVYEYREYAITIPTLTLFKQLRMYAAMI